MAESWTYETWIIGRVMVHRDEKGRFAKGHRHLPEEWKTNISEGTTEAMKNIPYEKLAYWKNKPSKAHTPESYKKAWKTRREKYGSSGVENPEEWKAKISQSNSGRKLFPEHYEALQEGSKRRWDAMDEEERREAVEPMLEGQRKARDDPIRYEEWCKNLSEAKKKEVIS